MSDEVEHFRFDRNLQFSMSHHTINPRVLARDDHSQEPSTGLLFPNNCDDNNGTQPDLGSLTVLQLTAIFHNFSQGLQLILRIVTSSLEKIFVSIFLNRQRQGDSMTSMLTLIAVPETASENRYPIQSPSAHPPISSSVQFLEGANSASGLTQASFHTNSLQSFPTASYRCFNSQTSQLVGHSDSYNSFELPGEHDHTGQAQFGDVSMISPDLQQPRQYPVAQVGSCSFPNYVSEHLSDFSQATSSEFWMSESSFFTLPDSMTEDINNPSQRPLSAFQDPSYLQSGPWIPEPVIPLDSSLHGASGAATSVLGNDLILGAGITIESGHGVTSGSSACTLPNGGNFTQTAPMTSTPTWNLPHMTESTDILQLKQYALLESDDAQNRPLISNQSIPEDVLQLQEPTRCRNIAELTKASGNAIVQLDKSTHLVAPERSAKTLVRLAQYHCHQLVEGDGRVHSL
jgi:hypothetical protein